MLADMGHDAGSGAGVDDAELAELEAVLGTPPAQPIATVEAGPTWAEFVEGWDLFRDALRVSGPTSVLIEWDTNIPEWERLSEEAARARAIYDETLAVATGTRP